MCKKNSYSSVSTTNKFGMRDGADAFLPRKIHQ